MSTGKRLAKRSILGTRIVAPGQDGRFYPAVIQAVKNLHGSAAAADRAAVHGERSRLPARYTVRFDNSRKLSEFFETDLIGPGFGGVSGLQQLMAGQRVYLTHLGREMEGTIMSHDTAADQLVVNIASGLQLKVRLEDIRLLESRKSSRLMNQTNTDFSKLADFNIVHERKRLNSEKSSDGSDFLGSRKRRGSETLSEEEERSSGDEHGARSQGHQRHRGHRRTHGGQRLRKDGRRSRTEAEHVAAVAETPRSSVPMHPKKMFSMRRSGSPVIMTECTAAMVLMDLSCSPAHRGRMSHASGHSDASSGQMSPSSSGVSSLGTSWSCPSPTLTPPFPLPPTPTPTPTSEPDPDPVEALLLLKSSVGVAGGVTAVEPQESDEGIVSDQSNEFDDKKTDRVQTIYQCTWPGCHVRKDLCEDIERHVREKHLRRPAPATPEEDDHEEEFYYNEVEVPVARAALCKAADKSLVIQPVAKPVLCDHMDMARPPHENPEYGSGAKSPAPATMTTIISTGSQGGQVTQWADTSRASVVVDKAATLTTAAAAPAPAAATGLPRAVPIAIPITTFAIASSQHSPGKYIRLSPKPYTSSPKSPLRRPRGDAKKCRKVYGMEHRELWCTQCKWKKACTRFGEGA